MPQATGARRVVEIRALRGETTIRMLDDLGLDAELHVIDPAPQFDPAEHERALPGRYHHHHQHGLSLDVLPTLGPVDAALIDGDHNWYTSTTIASPRRGCPPPRHRTPGPHLPRQPVVLRAADLYTPPSGSW